ncbi:MAG: diguanylate cyclase [Pseudomonadota bacterium]
MNPFSKDDASVKVLIDLLREDFTRTTLNSEEWKQLEKNFGENIYAEIIYFLTQMEFEPLEAREHWYKTFEHRKNLSQVLGRDVGLRVALCDYFTNINPKLKNHVFVEVQLFLQKERSALVDELTGLYNRRFFNQVIQREMEHAKRFDQPFSLLMLDVDHFKNYNDMFGHQAGDRALTELAEVLTRTARAIDHVVRYGGEEFALILPRADKTQALMAAERHRRAVEIHPFSDKEKLPSGNLTVTIGMATCPNDALDALDLIQRADEALYKGKETGRNRAVSLKADKRRYPRYALSIEMMFRLREAAERSFLRGTTQDISMGGMLCQTDQPVDLNRPLEVILSSPSENYGMQLQAKVVRLTKDTQEGNMYYLGLSFELGSGEEKEALKNLIDQDDDTLH